MVNAVFLGGLGDLGHGGHGGGKAGGLWFRLGCEGFGSLDLTR
jgi:hypothetical protein